MKRTMFFGIFILVASLPFGCATGPQFSMVQPNMVSESPDEGRIFFYRTSALGAAIKPAVMLNGEKVGKAIAKGFFFVDRPAGDYEVVTSTEVKRKVSFVLEKGQTRFIKFNVSMGFFAGHVYGELVDESVGMSEIVNCKYTGGDTS